MQQKRGLDTQTKTEGEKPVLIRSAANQQAKTQVTWILLCCDILKGLNTLSISNTLVL